VYAILVDQTVFPFIFATVVLAESEVIARTTAIAHLHEAIHVNSKR
jgi:hypothetical protein